MSGDIEHPRFLTLRLPETLFMRLGAFASSAIPMTMAAMMLWPYINYIKWGCKPAGASGKCLEYWPGRNEPQLWEFPVGFTCLFLTPVVCWICCRYVRREIGNRSLRFGDLTRFTVLTSIKWQALAGIIHLLIIAALGWKGFIDFDALVGLVFVVFFAVIVHGFIAMFITLPLSLICVATFRVIALRRSPLTDENNAV